MQVNKQTWASPRRWYEIVGSRDDQHLTAGTRVEKIKKLGALASYLSNYLGKIEQKQVPADYRNCGRFWGASRVLRVSRWYTEGSYRGIAAYLRSYRHWYKIRAAREWGYRWEWSGFGFCLRGGAALPRPETAVSALAVRPLGALAEAERIMVSPEVEA